MSSLFCRHDKATIEELALTKQRVVSYEEGAKVAQSIEAVKYVECSAKSKDGIREVFDSATHFALIRSGKKKPSGGCSLV